MLAPWKCAEKSVENTDIYVRVHFKSDVCKVKLIYFCLNSYFNV